MIWILRIFSILFITLSVYEAYKYIHTDAITQNDIAIKKRRKIKSILLFLAGIFIFILSLYYFSDKKKKYGMNGRETYTSTEFRNYTQELECNGYRSNLPSFIMNRDMCYDTVRPDFIDDDSRNPFSYTKTKNIGNIKDLVENAECDEINEHAGSVIREMNECVGGNQGVFEVNMELADLFGPVRDTENVRPISGREEMRMPFMDGRISSRYFKEKNDLLIEENNMLKDRLRSRVNIPRFIPSRGVDRYGGYSGYSDD